MNIFQSLPDYEEFVYTLIQRFPAVWKSTLIVIRRGKRMATLQGELFFLQGYRITLKERLSFDEGLVVIEDMGMSCGIKKIKYPGMTHNRILMIPTLHTPILTTSTFTPILNIIASLHPT